MWQEQRDKAGTILVISPQQLEATRVFFVEVAGFEEERVWTSPDGEVAWVGYRYGPSRIQLAVPGALPDLPEEGTQHGVLAITVPDSEALHRVIEGRAAGAPGPMRDLGSAASFVLVTPGGFRLLFVSYREESPTQLGDLGPEQER